MKKIVFTVTNDLSFDQRMQRICSCLAENGYYILLVGRKLKDSKPLQNFKFHQKRLGCFFNKGLLFYIEYNIRLFVFLLKTKSDVVCAIDLDTILPVLFSSSLKSTQRVYDAHELFTEQKEIKSRPVIYKCWKWIEKFSVPKFKNGYTVNEFISNELQKLYQVQYAIVRNVPAYFSLPNKQEQPKPYFIYQGAVNEGRSFETLIPALQHVNTTLRICGTGNFISETKKLTKEFNVENKVIFEGLVLPKDLKIISTNAFAGIMIFEEYGLNQVQSLANRFFDYIMAGIPQICINFPEYKRINDQYQIAYMINDVKMETIANAMNKLMTDSVLYETLKQNCLKAREELNWSFEQKKLLNFYKELLN